MQVQRLHGQKAVHLSILSSHDQEYNTWNGLAEMNRDVMVQLDFAPKWAGYEVPGAVEAADEATMSHMNSSTEDHTSTHSTLSSDGEGKDKIEGVDACQRQSKDDAGGGKGRFDEGQGRKNGIETDLGGSLPSSSESAVHGDQNITRNRLQWHMWVLLSRPTWISAELEDKDTDALIEQLIEQLGQWAADAHLLEV